jgi:hypothetical protein
MSSCSQIFSEGALLQKVWEMAQSLSELRDLQRRVRQAEAREPVQPSLCGSVPEGLGK